MAPRDPNTLANYGEWRTKHTTVNFRVNFEKQRLEGSVLLELESLTDKKSREIILGRYFARAVHVSHMRGLGLDETDRWLRVQSPCLGPASALL
jgi:hypothetical protein